MFYHRFVHNTNNLGNETLIKQNEGWCPKCCNREKSARVSVFDFHDQRFTESMWPTIWSFRRQIARYYAFVNEKRSPEWWNLADFTIPLANDDIFLKYDLACLVGSGRYGAVYKAYFYEDYEEYDIKKDEKYVIKVLRQTPVDKIKKEIKILKCLSGGPNIVKLHTVLRSYIDGQYLLVMEAAFGPLSDIWRALNREEIRYYMYQLLKALDYGHRNGIIHRDVKPQNIVIDPKSKRLLLIDWGIADFYFPRHEYALRPGTLPYKAPELLLGYKMLDYAIDMWAFSCILAGFLFHTMPFYQVSSPDVLLICICRFLGTRAMLRYIDKYDIPAPRKVIYQAAKMFGPDRTPVLNIDGWFSRLSMRWGITKPGRVSRSGFHLLLVTMRFDHHQRLSAAEAMEHPFFRGVRSMTDQFFNS